MREEKLLAYLKSECSGKQRTAKSADLEHVIGISGTDLRKFVNALRGKGVPIASSKDGYFYAITAGEVYATIRQLKTMVKGLEAAIHGLEQSLDQFGPGTG